MMRGKFFTKYYMDENLILTSLPYGNKAYSMYFVLPGEGKSFGEMTKQLLVPGYWSQCISWSETLDVDIYIPKFEVQYKNDELINVLVKMGMGIACSSQAQFTQITESSNFYVSGSKTKTYIKVEEKGTEAAAVTEIGLVGLGEPSSNEEPVFRADRPFLFVIRENSTETILFMGKIGDPTEK
jgi:serpin B